MRHAKAKSGTQIGRVGRHNFRIGKLGKGVDETRSHLNLYVGAQSVKELHANVKTAIATATRKPRPDASKMVEFFCGASPEFFDGKTYDESKAYLDDCLDWARNTFGYENVIGAQYHFDEKTPHIHIEVVPMADTIKKTKHTETKQRTLNAAYWMDGKKKMEDLQTSFAKFVQERGHKLERGEPKAERLAMGGNVKHKPVRQWHEEQIAEAKNITNVAEEILTNAAHEEKKAADFRRQLQNERARVLSQLDDNIAHAKILKSEAKRQKALGDKLKEIEEELRKKAEHIAKATANLVEIPIPVVPAHVEPVVEYQPDYMAALDAVENYRSPKENENSIGF